MDANNMSPAVRAALARRSQGSPAPALQQITPAAQAVNSPVAPNPLSQSAMTKSSAMPTTPKAPSQKFEPQNQQDALVMSLIEQMKTNNKLQSEKNKMAQGQSIQSPPPATPSFNTPPPQSAGSGVFGTPSTSSPLTQQGNPFGQSPF